MDSSKMYKEIILDHYKNPRNYGCIEDPTLVIEGNNPSCGDMIKIYINIKNEKIQDLKYKSDGCAISTASMSMLSEDIIGKDIDHILNKSTDDIIDMLGIEVSPLRVKCAVLGNKIIKKEINENL